MKIGSCDFCSSPTGPGKRSYFPHSVIIMATEPTNCVDTGEWVACCECSRLIEGKEWKALMERAQSLNPGLRAALWAGKLRECSEFVAITWAAIFDQPSQVFFL